MKNILRLVASLGVGTFFGLILTKGRVIEYEKIQAMFHMQEPDLYLIIGSAAGTGALMVFLLKRLGLKDVYGEEVDLQPKSYQHGLMIGGALFGMGWYITGTCPGPIYAQIGTGTWPALFTLAGALLGTYLYALLKKKLPH